MKTSDDTLLKGTQSILLIGPPGGGKTTLALQWPKLYVADCDQNLSGPMRWLKDKNTYRPFSYDRIAYDDNDKPIIDLAKQWDRLILKLNEAIKSPDVDTIFIDSLTHIDRILYAWMKWKLKVEELEWNNYATFKTLLYRLIMDVRSSGKTVLVACHEQIERDKQGNVKRYKPVVSTNLSQYFAYMFTDVWRCRIKDLGAGKTQAVIQVTPTPTSELKNSVLLAGEIEASYPIIQAAINRTKL